MGVSGVIAVCTYGLYGCATTRWGMSPAAAASGVFDSFWDTIGFITNGLVFFYAGVATTNFFVRSTQVRDPAGRVRINADFKELPTPFLWLSVSKELAVHALQCCCSAQAALLELRQAELCPGLHVDAAPAVPCSGLCLVVALQQECCCRHCCRDLRSLAAVSPALGGWQPMLSLTASRCNGAIYCCPCWVVSQLCLPSGCTVGLLPLLLAAALVFATKDIQEWGWKNAPACCFSPEGTSSLHP